MLKWIPSRTTDDLGTTLRAALGQPDGPADYDKLPVPSWDTLNTRIGKFFNGGFWLVDNDSDFVFEALDMVQTGIQSVTADFIVKNAGYQLVADQRMDSAEECGYSVGRQWMTLRDDEEYCFYLAGSPEEDDRVEADEGVYESLANYGLGERYHYYRSILDCALSGWEVKLPDLSSLPIGGVPACLFNMEAIYLDRKATGQCDAFGSSCTHWVSTPIE